MILPIQSPFVCGGKGKERERTRRGKERGDRGRERGKKKKKIRKGKGGEGEGEREEEIKLDEVSMKCAVKGLKVIMTANLTFSEILCACHLHHCRK